MKVNVLKHVLLSCDIRVESKNILDWPVEGDNVYQFVLLNDELYVFDHCFYTSNFSSFFSVGKSVDLIYLTY